MLLIHDASQSDDGVVKFVGTLQNHLLRLEHSLSRDDEPESMVQELILSWSQQAILLLQCGFMFYATLFYPRQSFRDNFAPSIADTCRIASPSAFSPDPDGVWYFSPASSLPISLLTAREWVSCLIRIFLRAAPSACMAKLAALGTA